MQQRFAAQANSGEPNDKDLVIIYLFNWLLLLLVYVLFVESIELLLNCI